MCNGILIVSVCAGADRQRALMGEAPNATYGHNLDVALSATWMWRVVAAMFALYWLDVARGRFWKGGPGGNQFN